MRAGGLTEKLRLLRPVSVTNAYGEESTVYEEVATVRAERSKFRGNRTEEAGEHFSDYRAEFNIRDGHEVRENWRAEHLGADGHLYVITNIIPNIARRMRTLICERVNE